MSTTTIKIRRGASTEWTNANPVLNLAEPGLETDTRSLKFGDGITEWNFLPYAVIGGSMQSWLDFSSSYDPNTIVSASINNITASLELIDQKTNDIINNIIPGVEQSVSESIAIVDQKTGQLFEAFDSQSIVLFEFSASFDSASASLVDRVVVLATASSSLSARLLELDSEFEAATASLQRLDGVLTDASSAFATSLLGLSANFGSASASFVQQFSAVASDSQSFALSITTLKSDFEDASSAITTIDEALSNNSQSFAARFVDLDSSFESASASFSSRIITLAEASSAFAGELTTFGTALGEAEASITRLDGALVDSSSAFATSLTALSSSYENASSSFLQQFSTLSTASSSFASNISSLSSSFTTASSSLNASISNIESTYVTENAAIGLVSSRITASFNPTGIGSSSIAAGVAQEASVRATADGNLAGQYVLNVAAGDVVTGMKITSISGSAVLSDITFSTDNFKVKASTGDAVQLLNLSAGAAIFTPNVQSSNFSAGTTGWRITNSGDAEFNSLTVRQSILHPLASPVLSPASSLFESSINPTITQAAAQTIRFTTDGTYPVLSGGTATTITSGNSLPSAITTTTAVRAVAYNSAGQSSPEAVAVYTKSVGVANSYSLEVENIGGFTGQNSTILYPENTFIVKEFIKNQCGDFNLETTSANVVVTGASSTKTDTGGVIRVELTLTENTKITVTWTGC
jgi:hypothetical protein